VPATQQQNPDWAREELILACDLVSQNQWRQMPADDPRVRELSDLLQRLPLHRPDRRQTTFRNPNGVARKTADIATNRPGYSGRPTRCGALDKKVIAEFLAQPVVMHELAYALRQGDALGDFAELNEPVADEDLGEEEGRLRLLVRRHVLRERSLELRRRKIASVLRAGRGLACEVCGFNFEETYGPRGKGHIDCHHILPLHVTGIRVTRLADLALLCANCHRMIHVRAPWLSPDQLQQLIVGSRSSRLTD
jgi:5-methylcytosine-specific restriction protein A